MPATFNIARRHLLLGGAGLALSGCAPTSAFARQSALPRTQAVLDAWIADGRLPGATVGVRFGTGAPVFLQAGAVDYGAAPTTPDSLFRIYSMTKPVTGVAAALLIEDGLLTLDTPVADVIPEFAALRVATDPEHSLDTVPLTSPMRVRHLLTHTSGLSYHFMDQGPVSAAYRRAGVFPVTGFNLAPDPALDAPTVVDLDAMARALATIPLRFQPGSAYHYSCGLDVLGLVIQRVSGMSFPDFVQRRLLNPIGMSDTVWRLRPGDADRFAAFYFFENGGRELIDGPANSDYAKPVTLFAGGAGLVSSTRDYLAFLSTVLNDGKAGSVQVMRPETARLIHTDIMAADMTSENGAGFGFGGSVKRLVDPATGAVTPGDWGWSGAAGTKGWINPQRGFAAVLMVQFFPWGASSIQEEIVAALEADLAA